MQLWAGFEPWFKCSTASWQAQVSVVFAIRGVLVGPAVAMLCQGESTGRRCTAAKAQRQRAVVQSCLAA